MGSVGETKLRTRLYQGVGIFCLNLPGAGLLPLSGTMYLSICLTVHLKWLLLKLPIIASNKTRKYLEGHFNEPLILVTFALKYVDCKHKKLLCTVHNDFGSPQN